jgi:hypothetical protein
VGSYSVHGVLVENSCGQLALPTASPLDFVVEIRQDAGLAYWTPNNSPQNAGSLSSAGMFRFTMSQTQVVNDDTTTQSLEPADFQNGRGDFDLTGKRVCALTMKQTVLGSLKRRLKNGAVESAGGATDAGEANAQDLVAEHVIELTPTSGSDCTRALMALGGTYRVLPCEARYDLTGTLDASSAVTVGAAMNTGTAAGAGAQATGGTR